MFLLTGQVVSNASCMALLSDGRAWAAVEKCELGLDEIGLIVLVSMLLARMWPCQRNRRGQERRVERSVQVGCAARCRDECRRLAGCRECVWKSTSNAESPHAAATPMMARVRKPTARCPAVGASTAVVFSVSVSFFCLVVVFLVWVLVWVSVCSILTWNVPNLLCRAETPWSCRNRAGGSRACPRGEVVQLERGFGSGYGVEARKRKYRQD